MRLLTGIKPTGALHLGNYVGAIRPALSLLSDTTNEAFLFVADGHALTSVTEGAALKQMTYEVAAAWMAAGLDVDRVVFYRQSQIPEVFMLFWILSCLAPKGLMNRAHAYKAIVQPRLEKNEDDIDRDVFMGLYNYPILMTADIVLFSAQKVPVGPDQKQHVEIARDLAIKFNQTYGDVLQVPQPAIQKEAPSLAGLDGRKMSKSYHNVIPLFADDATLRKLIFKIKTTSQRPEEPKDPKTCNLFQLFAAFATADEKSDISKRYASGIGWAQMKEATFDVVARTVAPMRQRYKALMQDIPLIEQKLKAGEERARLEAKTLMSKVCRAIGF
ncbi:MAG: tryptophan--tRNA ligase [Holosporaceae bacterium]